MVTRRMFAAYGSNETTRPFRSSTSGALCAIATLPKDIVSNTQPTIRASNFHAKRFSNRNQQPLRLYASIRREICIALSVSAILKVKRLLFAAWKSSAILQNGRSQSLRVPSARMRQIQGRRAGGYKLHLRRKINVA
jgi:hypothetical protein